VELLFYKPLVWPEPGGPSGDITYPATVWPKFPREIPPRRYRSAFVSGQNWKPSQLKAPEQRNDRIIELLYVFEVHYRAPALAWALALVSLVHHALVYLLGGRLLKR